MTQQSRLPSPPAPVRLEVVKAAERRRPSDWRWQIRHAISSVAQLAAAVPLTQDELEGAHRAERAGMPIGITPYYLSLVDPRDPRCPVRLQCVPTAREAEEVPGDLVDPLGEVAHEVAPHLVQRYPDRAHGFERRVLDIPRSQRLRT